MADWCNLAAAAAAAMAQMIKNLPAMQKTQETWVWNQSRCHKVSECRLYLSSWLLWGEEFPHWAGKIWAENRNHSRFVVKKENLLERNKEDFWHRQQKGIKENTLLINLNMGLLWDGRDWATSLSLFTFTQWRRKWHPTPVFLPGESQGWQSLVGCRLWGRTESDTTEAT